jgi:hypothetical protein
LKIRLLGSAISGGGWAQPIASHPTNEDDGRIVSHPTEEDDGRIRKLVTDLLVDMASPLSPVDSWVKSGLMVMTDRSMGDIFGPFADWDEREEYRTKWVQEAPAAWLDTIIDLVRTPPDLSEWGPRIRDEWDYEATRLLEEWACRAPDAVFYRVRPLLAAESSRVLALDVIGEAISYHVVQRYGKNNTEFPFLNDPLGQQAISDLEALVDRVRDLSEDEQVALIGALIALDQCGLNKRDFLRRVRDLTPPVTAAALKEIGLYPEPPLTG